MRHKTAATSIWTHVAVLFDYILKNWDLASYPLLVGNCWHLCEPHCFFLLITTPVSASLVTGVRLLGGVVNAKKLNADCHFWVFG
jgi:hypothetical protein